MNRYGANTDDAQLERLFSQARCFELLTGEQEQETDRSKWQSLQRILAIMAADSCGRLLLAAWCRACAESPPAIEQFSNRELYFLLRREVAELADGGNDRLHACLECLLAPPDPEHDAQALTALAIPAALVAGLAEAASAPEPEDAPGGLAGAIRDWMAHWPGELAGLTLSAAAAADVRCQLQEYYRARDRLVAHNLRLVFTVAGKFSDQGGSYLDLVQEGVLGLIRAAEKFRFQRGYRFSTYAYNWIAQAVRRGLKENAETIRYPMHVHEQLAKLYRERARMLSVTGTTPGDGELAAATGLQVDKVQQLLQLRNRTASLDEPRFEEDEVALVERIPGEAYPPPSAAADRQSLRRLLDREIERLSPAEQQVVRRRWGLEDRSPLSRAEIAEQLSLSTERIRQLEKSALHKLAQSDDIYPAYMLYQGSG